jgi:hypothetical protein
LAVGASSFARGFEKFGYGADVGLGGFVVAMGSFSWNVAGMLLCFIKLDMVGG